MVMWFNTKTHFIMFRALNHTMWVTKCQLAGAWKKNHGLLSIYLVKSVETLLFWYHALMVLINLFLPIFLVKNYQIF